MENLYGQLFVTEAILGTPEQGRYNLLLVLVSYIVASLASYVALAFATRMATHDHTQVSKRTLHISGAFSMGAGIWSMHFIGMLAYHMSMVVSYDPFITFLSMLVAIVIAYLVLYMLDDDRLPSLRVVSGAIVLGIGICTMHYTGMAAMRMDAHLRYKPALFMLSVAIAIFASAAALLIIFSLTRRQWKHQTALRVVAALVMGLAICGMHYTGMAAAVFIPFADCRYDPDQSFTGMATAIAVITLIILAVALFFSAEPARKENNTLANWIYRLFYERTVWIVAVTGLTGGLLVYWHVTQSEHVVLSTLAGMEHWTSFYLC